MDKKARPIYMLLTRNSPQTQRHAQTKSQGMEKHISDKQQREESRDCSTNKIDFKTNKVTRDKEGHYIMIKGSVQQEDITILHIYQ